VPSLAILQKTHLTLTLLWTIGAGLSRRSLPALPVRLDAALTALLERLSVLEPVAAAATVAATPELTDQAGMYMMLQASSDGAVALC
jgi:hypothetical protein